MKHATLLLILAVAFTGTAFGHNGLTNFLPTVPDPLAINIDGLEDDWDWYDRDFANTDIISILGQKKGQGVNPAPDDFSMAWFMAWSPPPGQRLLFLRPRKGRYPPRRVGERKRPTGGTTTTSTSCSTPITAAGLLRATRTSTKSPTDIAIISVRSIPTKSAPTPVV